MTFSLAFDALISLWTAAGLVAVFLPVLTRNAATPCRNRLTPRF